MRPSSSPSRTSCAASTSSPSTAGWSCHSPFCVVSTASEPTKADVLARYTSLKGRVENVEPVLCAVSGEQFYNTSPLDFRRLLDDSANVPGNLRSYIAGFSPAARDVIDKFGFDAQITRLADKNLLYLVVSQFADIDL